MKVPSKLVSQDILALKEWDLNLRYEARTASFGLASHLVSGGGHSHLGHTTLFFSNWDAALSLSLSLSLTYFCRFFLSSFLLRLNCHSKSSSKLLFIHPSIWQVSQCLWNSISTLRVARKRKREKEREKELSCCTLPSQITLKAKRVRKETEPNPL